jgi:hypothetical protein
MHQKSFVIAFYSAVFSFAAEVVNADAFAAAHQELESVKSSCYPDVDAESVVAPEIFVSGVLSEIFVGLNGKTTAYVINPQYLVCGGKSAGLCGTRGCNISIFAGQDKFVYTGWHPEIVIYGNSNLVLLPQSGWACGMLVNSSPCFSVLSWDDVVQKFVYRFGVEQ